jgi:hypothetical protein
VTAPPITRVRLTSASFHQSRAGLIGYVTLQYGDLLVDGITLRVTSRGRPTLTFPARRDQRGREHPLVRPADRKTRDAIEAAVFAALGLEGTR